MSVKPQKRKNFTNEETKKLLDLINPHIEILQSKGTTWHTNEEKNKVWCEIEQHFNSEGGNYRNKDSLMHLWENLKTQAKKRNRKKYNDLLLMLPSKNYFVLERVRTMIGDDKILKFPDNFFDKKFGTTEDDITQEDLIEDTNIQNEQSTEDGSYVDSDQHSSSNSCTSKKKKKSKINYTIQESEKLLSLMGPKLGILLNKKQDWQTNNEKIKAWAQIEKEFNTERDIFRNRDSLIKHWNHLKKSSKSEVNCKCCQTKNTSKLTDTNRECLFDRVRAMGGSNNSAQTCSSIDDETNKKIEIELLEDASQHNTVFVKSIKTEAGSVYGDTEYAAEDCEPLKRAWTRSISAESQEASNSSTQNSSTKKKKHSSIIEAMKKQLLQEEIQYKRKLYTLQLQAAKKDLEIKTKILNQIKSRVNGDVMTQAHEPLNIMDGTPDYSTKTKHGFHLSKTLGIIILVIFVLSLVTASLLVYNYAACPRTDQLANVTKYELCHCDQSKLLVLPLTTESSRSVVPLDTTDNSIAVVNLRLLTDVKPDKYIIKIVPYIFEGNFTFDGEVSIVIVVVNETKEITFNGIELTIHNVILYSEEEGISVRVVKRIEDPLRHFHILTLGSVLKVGKRYLLNISYTGILNDNLHGFYRSSYEDKGVKKWIAVTQFQAMDARRAFPCWDEPAFKARFTISIARPSNMTSLSNMNVIKHERHELLKDYMWDHYAESLPMSTYLVAFTVTDFQNMTSNNFSVWARKEALPAAAFALKIGPKILQFLEDYYKIKFPLPKIDMIALPDFKNGAMENWGLLTFREIAMLYEEGVSASTDKVHVATVVAHEIAHQWFGNLVTPSWWRDLWLNEGFATYVEYVAVNAVEKSWNITETCILDQVHNVFQLDALNSSHQLSVDVTASEETDAIFDKISYGKGSALLRMLNHILTDDVFNAGVTNYLNSKMYGNAEQRDLWNALTSAARMSGDFDADVAVVMDSWTLQTGFPVLTIIRDYKNGGLLFSQERFVLINDTFASQKSPVWWIPVSYTSASEKDFSSTRPKIWLKGEKTLSVSNASLKHDEWFIANIQQTGFYRVNYDQKNWQLLIKILKDPARFQDIHVINRAQLVDDAMNLALTGRLDYKTALDVTSYLAHERSYVPWKAGLSALGYIDTVLSKGAYYLEYGRYVLRLLGDAVKEVGWKITPNESVITAQYRVDLLASACHFEHPDCLENAVRMYTNWMFAPNPDAYNEIDVDVRGIVYCVGVRAGGAREWTFAWERFQRAAAPAERHRLLAVLGCTRSPSLLHRYLEMSLRNDSGIRKQDIVRVFSAVAGTGIGQPIAFNFIRSNWQRLKTYVGSLSTINLIVKVVTKRLNQAHEYDELKRFVSESCTDLGRPVQQVLETIAANVQWRDRNYQTIVDWLLKADKAVS